MEIKGLAFLPFVWVTWTLLGLGALLTLTITLGHNQHPYISDTGIAFPESFLYTIVYLVSAILGVGVAHIQYKFMVIRAEISEKRYIIFQRILYSIAWITCIGTAINAVYSVKSNPLAHRIGAGMAFFGGVIYNLCQAIFLYRRSFSSRCMCHIRLAVALVTIVDLLLFIAGMGAFYVNLCTGRCEMILYVPVLVAEYVGFSSLVLYQLTTYTDFQQLSLKFFSKGMTICLREKTPDPENIQE